MLLVILSSRSPAGKNALEYLKKLIVVAKLTLKGVSCTLAELAGVVSDLVIVRIFCSFLLAY